MSCSFSSCQRPLRLLPILQRITVVPISGIRLCLESCTQLTTSVRFSKRRALPMVEGREPSLRLRASTTLHVLRVATKYTSTHQEMWSSPQVSIVTNVWLRHHEQSTLTFDLVRIVCLNLIRFQFVDELHRIQRLSQHRLLLCHPTLGGWRATRWVTRTTRLSHRSD